MTFFETRGVAGVNAVAQPCLSLWLTDCANLENLIPVRHSGGPLGLTLTLTLTLTPGMADLLNGGPPEWGAGTENLCDDDDEQVLQFVFKTRITQHIAILQRSPSLSHCITV